MPLGKPGAHKFLHEMAGGRQRDAEHLGGLADRRRLAVGEDGERFHLRRGQVEMQPRLDRLRRRRPIEPRRRRQNCFFTFLASMEHARTLLVYGAMIAHYFDVVNAFDDSHLFDLVAWSDRMQVKACRHRPGAPRRVASPPYPRGNRNDLNASSGISDALSNFTQFLLSVASMRRLDGGIPFPLA